MKELLRYTVLLMLVRFSFPAGAGLRTRRDVHCREHHEYLHGNMCCLNCPAGTRTVSPCTASYQRGQCVECEDGTFTEHSNHLKFCLTCLKCRHDQEVVRPCTHTQNAECRCRPGRFCDPDQACETCKRCLTCKSDEVTVRNCTPTSNTECKKIQPETRTSPALAAWIVLGVIIVLAIALGVFVWCYRKRKGGQRTAGGLKPGQDRSDHDPAESGPSGLVPARPWVRGGPSCVCVEDERKALCESSCSSSSNSQHSLTGLHSYAAAPAPAASPLCQAASAVDTPPSRREDEEFPKLVPVKGEESLRRSFEYFEEMDIDYHKRFFRHLGIADNVIKSKDNLPYGDRIHELLNIWMEKEGKDASLNDLLKALLYWNQKGTAEAIMDNAIRHGHYFCEEAM